MATVTTVTPESARRYYPSPIVGPLVVTSIRVRVANFDSDSESITLTRLQVGESCGRATVPGPGFRVGHLSGHLSELYMRVQVVDSVHEYT